MRIKRILVDGQGWKHSTDGEITAFLVNGEMANVTWYQQTLKDGRLCQYNGKYVVQIDSAEE